MNIKNCWNNTEEVVPNGRYRTFAITDQLLPMGAIFDPEKSIWMQYGGYNTEPIKIWLWMYIPPEDNIYEADADNDKDILKVIEIFNYYYITEKSKIRVSIETKENHV